MCGSAADARRSAGLRRAEVQGPRGRSRRIVCMCPGRADLRGIGAAMGPPSSCSLAANLEAAPVQVRREIQLLQALAALASSGCATPFVRRLRRSRLLPLCIPPGWLRRGPGLLAWARKSHFKHEPEVCTFELPPMSIGLRCLPHPPQGWQLLSPRHCFSTPTHIRTEPLLDLGPLVYVLQEGNFEAECKAISASESSRELA
mmetsp:Transcript_156449/g.479912  ORF Transcript_156449/g.479912 Transcript_156449/m.479912 type:complete len:202 (+) Transcript_156449:35-640(+)